jgi:Predicted xylanase/chitin deacetylase
MRKGVTWGLTVLVAVFVGLFCYWKMAILPMGQSIPILCYHKISEDADKMSISPERFRAQLAELKKMGYRTIHLEEAYGYWQSGESLPEGALVITFDDGYQDNLLLAEPILQEAGEKATVFLITKRVLRWDFLDWDEVRALQKAGWEMGSHSWSHVDLTARTNFHGEVEIRKSRLEIEKRSGGDAFWLAYPFGVWNEEAIRWAKESGYHGAVTTRIGFGGPEDGLFTLDRIPVIPNGLPAELDMRLRLLRAEGIEFFRWVSR